MSQKRMIGRLVLIATVTRPFLVLFMATGMLVDWLRGQPLGAATLTLSCIGGIAGVSLGMMLVRRLQAKGYVFPIAWPLS